SSGKRRWWSWRTRALWLEAGLAVVIAVAALSQCIPPTIHSLAVLPFGSLSQDTAQDYVAPGITDALITQLSSIHTLRVISLTSVMHYQHDRPPMPQIARELGVEYVIEGNVMKAHDLLQSSVRLIDARQDRIVWSEKYDGDTADVPGLHARIAADILAEIKAKVTRAENRRLHRPV